MREIKFRSWHIKKKKMFCVESLHLQDEYCVLNDGDIYSDAFCVKTSEIELMQFTGLTDKNGVEIYEGDLVKKGDDKFVKSGVVSFIHGCWMVASKSGEQYFNLHWHLSQVEIVGNVHQNPELLEYKDDE